MEFWYRYRNDLWKRVTLWDRSPDGSSRPRKNPLEGKLPENIRRAARMIEGYALCNDWQWFGTFTLNGDIRDRSDLDGFRDAFMQYLRNVRRSTGTDVQALLVPELHKNKKGWHMHGLLNGLPVESLRRFEKKERLPRYLKQKINQGEAIYDWPGYRDRFGWVDIEPVKNRDAAARYITKYITKGRDLTAKEIGSGKHLYYATKGLSLPERIETDDLFSAPRELPNGLVKGNSYEFDYGVVEWYERPKHTKDYHEELIRYDKVPQYP